MLHRTPGALSTLQVCQLASGGHIDRWIYNSATQSFREMPRWRADIIRKRAEHLGTVEAATEKEAIEKAVGRFEIPPERRNRIAVQKSRCRSGAEIAVQKMTKDKD